MSNTFQFAERLGFEPPFEFSDSTTKSIYRTGVINWTRLINRLNNKNLNLKTNYVIGQITDINESNKRIEDYILFSSKKRLYNVFIDDKVDKPYKPGEQEYYFKALISTQSNKTISKKNAGYSYNIALENDGFQRYRVLFPFNGISSDDLLPDRYAISIESDNFEKLEVLLKDLNLEYSEKKKREIFKSFNSYFDSANGDPNIIDGLYEIAPKFVIEYRGKQQLINDLILLLEVPVDENGTNEEFVVLDIIKALLKITKTKNEFLELFLKYFNDNHSLLSLITFRLDGENFKEFVTIIQNAWKDSSYAQIDPEKNKTITENSPILLGYNSDEKLGFHTDNAYIDWKKSINKVNIDMTIGTGVYKSKNVYYYELKEEKTVTHNYKYHPYSPIVIVNASNPKFIYEDDDQKDANFTKMPVFVICAENETAFWKNVITATEYAVDIATTFSGVGNILKVGRLAKILKAGHTLIGKTKTATKAIKTAKTVAGIVEVTSGVGNALLKLAGKNNTPFGRAITKYLFYLEMLSLSGELSVALHVALKKNANDIIGSSKNRAKLKTELDGIKIDEGNVSRKLSDTEIDEVIEHLVHVAGAISKKQLRLWKTNVKGGRYNCANCAMAVDNTLAGKSASALPWTYVKKMINGEVVNKISFENGTFLTVLEKEYGKKFIKDMNPDLIRSTLKPGQRGIVFGQKKGNNLGHVFNVTNENGVIKFLDGQKIVKKTTDTQKADLIYDYYEFLPTNF